MPNHVTSRCTVHGPAEAVAAFRVRHIVESDEGEVFDFDTIIPMPQAIRDAEESSAAEEGMRLIEARGGGFPPFHDLGLYQNQMERIRREAGLEPLARIRDVAEVYLAKFPDIEKAGRNRLLALLETGFSSWYSWAMAKWGTKWGAYRYKVISADPFIFQFETAWDFPTPIFSKLAELHQALTFDCICFDEGHNFAGVGQFGAKVRQPFACSKELATDEMHERVYGHAPEREDEE